VPAGGRPPRPLRLSRAVEPSEFLVFPAHRLLFCHFEKVAGTQFRHLLFLLDRLRVDEGGGALPPGAQARHLENWKVRMRLPTQGMSVDDVPRLLADGRWLKAVFFRDPIERFLSGFESKCHGHDRDGRFFCQRAFGPEGLSFTAAQAARHLAAHWRGDAVDRLDLHFRPQARCCGGIGEHLEWYDVVKRLDRRTVREDVGAMLTRANVSLIWGHGRRWVPLGIRNMRVLNREFPPDGRLGQWVGQHATNATDKVANAFDAHALRLLMAFYAEDYRAFGRFGMRDPTAVGGARGSRRRV
jgi:hypothetical protein